MGKLTIFPHKIYIVTTSWKGFIFQGIKQKIVKVSSLCKNDGKTWFTSMHPNVHVVQTWV